ncbi:MAG: hypothetical protein JXB62_08585 [Pirellulales bacterium]|nr:hypothetical protein [Pirellulales bacterium]
MTELVFQVEESPDGRLVARAVDKAIAVEADSVEELPAEIRDAIDRHFAAAGARPDTVHLYFFHEGALMSTCTLALWPS